MASTSVVTITARPGIFRFGRETLEAQSFKDFEWVVVDKLYHKRYKEVAEYMKDSPLDFKHIPEPPKDKGYNLARADNEGIKKSTGELLVWLQDFILIPQDGLQKYWDLYKQHPDSMYSGVDGRFSIETAGKILTEDPIDIIGGASWGHGRTDYVNQRAEGKGVYQSYDPFEFELNWAAFARTVAEDIGGFNEDFDHGFAYDNTEFAFRALQMHKQLWIDTTNYADAINHWELFGGPEDPHVEHRNDAVGINRKKYQEYVKAVESGMAPIYMNYL
jgi:hypothetical protein